MVATIADIWEHGPRAARIGSERSYSTVWQVEMTGTGRKLGNPDDILTAMLADSRFYQYWPTWPAAQLYEATFQQKDEAKRLWDVNTTYSTQVSSGGLSGYQENPLNQPVQRSASFNSYQKPINRDINGELLRVTSGELIDPIEVEANRPEFRRTWNTTSFNWPLLQEYENAVNSDTFAGYAPGTLRIGGLTITETIILPNDQFPAGLTYYTIDATFQVRKEGWKLRYVNEGYYIKNPDDNDEDKKDPEKRIRIMSKVKNPDDDSEEQVPKETKSLLNEEGTAVLKDDEKPIIIEKDIYPMVPFGYFFPA